MIKRLSLIFLLFGLVSPAHASWIKAESQHFIAYSDGPVDDLKEDVLRLERYHNLLRMRLGITESGITTKLSVFLIRNATNISKLLGSGSNALGYYATSREGPLAVVPRMDEGKGNFAVTSDIILFHEYAHHLMLQYFTAPYPDWYVEGFAEFMAPTTFTINGKAKLGLAAKYRGYGLTRGFYIPIKELLGERGPRGDNFYGRSWLLVHYLSFSKQRRGQLQTYLNLIGEGVKSLDAAERAFGDIDTLGKELDRYQATTSIPYIEVDSLEPASDQIKFASLSDGQGEAMYIRIAMMGETRTKAKAARASAMGKIAANFANDAEVMALLAQAEHEAGNWDAAIAAADAAIKIDSTLTRALLAKGEAMMMRLATIKSTDAEKWKEARSWIVKANRSNPDQPAPLAAYYQSFIREGRAAPAMALNGLASALNRIPQEEGIRLQYVFALAREKRFADAAATLQPLANAPHVGKRIDLIRTLATRLDEAKAKNSLEDIDTLEKGFESVEEG